MGSIQLDGRLISIGSTFKCPVCQEWKKTMDFLARVKSGIYKTSDIICSKCFDEKMKEVQPSVQSHI